MSCTRLDLLDGHAHGRIFFAAECNFNGVIHADHLGGRHNFCTRMLKTSQGIGLTHQQKARFWVLL
jgi:hypothetical protein